MYFSQINATLTEKGIKHRFAENKGETLTGILYLLQKAKKPTPVETVFNN